MTTHVYVSAQNKGFNFTVEVKGKRKHVRFVDNQFKTDDDDLAAGINALIETNPGIGRRCCKTDIAAAEKLAREHRRMLQRTGATKGGITAEATRHAMDISLAERDLKLRSQNADVKEFEKENLQMTEAVVEAVVELPEKTETVAPVVKPLVSSKPIPSFAKSSKQKAVNAK